MTELPCPACHGEMAADWGGHRAQCGCGAEIHMGGGWLWPSFEVPLRPLMPDDGIEPPTGDWHFEGPELGLVLNGTRGSSSSSASVPVDITGARIATHKSAVCVVTREPVVEPDEDLPLWLRGRVVHLSQEWTLEWARSTAAHLNASRLRLGAGYRR